MRSDFSLSKYKMKSEQTIHPEGKLLHRSLELLVQKYCITSLLLFWCLKKNQTAPRPSEHPPVMGEKCQHV